MIGAASYGDIFTTNGLGLATPIEYMTSIETDYSVAPLDKGDGRHRRPGGAVARDRRSHPAQDPHGSRGHADEDVGRHVRHASSWPAAARSPARCTRRPARPSSCRSAPSRSAACRAPAPRTSASPPPSPSAASTSGRSARAGGDSGFTTDLVRRRRGGAPSFRAATSGPPTSGTVTYAHDNVVVGLRPPGRPRRRLRPRHGQRQRLRHLV